MLKRSFDIGVSLLALILLLPVIAVVALLVRRKLGAPVLLRKLRPGLDDKPYEMIEFRTMLDAGRMTPFGRFLRASGLHALPELWNVLKGNMSLVGPRPLPMEYLLVYSAEQYRRHEVRPGLTGWAQANGHTSVSWGEELTPLSRDEEFALDVWYVENRSLWLDLKLLSLAVKKVLVCAGRSAQGQSTRARFRGNRR